MAAEQLIEQILSKHPEVPREQIEGRLTKEKKKTNGLISDETLLRMIAAEFGIPLNANGRSPPELSMTSLVPGLNNVSVVGRVVAIYKPKAFTGHKNGKFASFFIADRSRILRVVFWNSKTDLLESGEVKVGEITRVSHGYTKEGREGIELHVGEKSKIETCPPEIGADGAVWRWSQAVGRVLLPGPGTGPPWRRLAVRLRGRPAGAGPPQPVVFFLDGRKIGDAALTGKEALVDLAKLLLAPHEFGRGHDSKQTGPPAAKASPRS